jgi:hypothetical protein
MRGTHSKTQNEPIDSSHRTQTIDDDSQGSGLYLHSTEDEGAAIYTGSGIRMSQQQRFLGFS